MKEIQLSLKEAEDVIAAVHVERKVRDLTGTGVPEAQVERSRAEARRRAYNALSPDAREALRRTLAKIGILRLDFTPANDANFLGKFMGGDAA